MFELIRKSLLAGLGAGVITKEKAQQAAQELVDEGKLAADDAKQFVDRLLEGANEQREEVQAGIRDAVRKALDSADVARAEDLQVIKQQLADLELRLAALESREKQEGSPRNEGTLTRHQLASVRFVRSAVEVEKRPRLSLCQLWYTRLAPITTGRTIATPMK